MLTVLDYQRGYTTEKEQELFDQLVTSFVVLGNMIGAGFGGKLIGYGRRRMIIIMAVVGSIGCGLTLCVNFYVLLIGRLLYGMASGVHATAAMRSVDEYVPLKYSGLAVGLWAANQNIGAFICLMSAVALPPEDTPEYDTTKVWMYVFAFPIVCYAGIILICFTCVTREGPKFCAANGQTEAAKLSIHKIYKTDGDESYAEQILEKI